MIYEGLPTICGERFNLFLETHFAVVVVFGDFLHIILILSTHTHHVLMIFVRRNSTNLLVAGLNQKELLLLSAGEIYCSRGVCDIVWFLYNL
jgi:hypothetical protein